MEWQPIETAPKDGTAVLISDGICIVALGYCDGKEWSFWEGDYDAEFFPEEDPQVVQLNGWVNGGPTHWMPLPRPPKE